MNVTDIFAIIGAVVSLASIIVKLTKTDVDDKILNKVISFLDYFSVFLKDSDKKILDANKKK